MLFGTRAARSAARELRATMNETSDDDEVRANGTEDTALPAKTGDGYSTVWPRIYCNRGAHAQGL